ncbi:hypothetical protein HDU76_004749 [Blyttiomyces sp. JEL0837]|nr:hypothetical protein HDU76_004749 [Blyttiomyces sp. JEL0837]
MQIVTILSAIAALATTLVAASPLETVVDVKLGGVQYASHVKFAGLNRRNPPPPTPTPGGGGNGKLVYNGGPIIPNVAVTPLLWGSGVTSASKLTGFYSAVTDSPYYDMLAQYSTPSQKLGRGTATQPITLSGYPTKTSLDNDNDIVPYLTSLVKSGALKPTDNTYFPIHFAPGIKISLQGQGSCSVFCAYHSTIDISSLGVGTKYLYYGVIPDQGGSCAGGCGSNSNAFNNLCSVSSHELVEATTDPAIGVVTGNTVAAPAAWYDSADGNNGGEIGDLCNGQQGTAAGYTIQLEWSNSAGGCVAA